MLDIAMIAGGLILLFVGGEALIKGAVSLAVRLGLSSLLVSAVVVGFGTSMPEMTVSIGAALKGASDIAVGNVVGSNIANILLIIGIAAVLSPIVIAGNAVKRDTVVMLAASVVLCGFALVGFIHFIAGLCMVLALIVYIAVSYRQDKRDGVATSQHVQQDVAGEQAPSLPKAVVLSVIGLALLIAGAYVLVEGAVSIARGFGISEAVIGLTIVAVGTSLPELATAVVAAYRKHTDVVIGNILGSNIFNILAILGVTAMIAPVNITGQIARYDVWIMLVVAIVLSVYLLRSFSIGRKSALLMTGAYIIYTLWLYNLQ